MGNQGELEPRLGSIAPSPNPPALSEQEREYNQYLAEQRRVRQAPNLAVLVGKTRGWRLGLRALGLLGDTRETLGMRALLSR